MIGIYFDGPTPAVAGSNLSFNSFQTLHYLPLIIRCWNNIARVVLPFRRGDPVSAIAQDGRVPRSKSSYGNVGFTFNLSYVLAAYVFPFPLSSFWCPFSTLRYV